MADGYVRKRIQSSILQQLLILYNWGDFVNNKDLINNDLKRLINDIDKLHTSLMLANKTIDKLEKENEEYVVNINVWKGLLLTYKKAIDLLKTKSVKLKHLDWNYCEYINDTKRCVKETILSPSEFNLLKGVFNCE